MIGGVEFQVYLKYIKVREMIKMSLEQIEKGLIETKALLAKLELEHAPETELVEVRAELASLQALWYEAIGCE